MNASFLNTTWNTIGLAILGVIAILTGEIIVFIMLAIILNSLTNIYEVLQEISNKLERNKHYE